MGYAGKVRHVKHCRPKNKLQQYGCDWCSEKILKGESMVSWGWFDGGEGYAIRVHPECYEAMLEMDDLGEFSPGENRRGCNCGRDADCQRCRDNKKLIEEGEKTD